MTDMRATRLDAASNPANLSFEMGTIAGNEAMIVTSYDGPVPDRVAMVYADTGALYSILAQPIEYTQYPGAAPYVEQMWEAITGSIQFFEPYD